MDNCTHCGAGVVATKTHCGTCGNELPKDDIKGLSEKWKARFALIEKAGGPTLKGMRGLSLGENFRVYFSIHFNFLALIFGVFYYLAKGMWRKGLTYSLFGFSLLLAHNLLYPDEESKTFEKAVQASMMGIFANRANIDYYRKVVLKSNGWL